MKKYGLLAVLGLFLNLSRAVSFDPSSTVWAVAPATHWKEGYPVGNGHLGLLSFGEWPQETFLLNEHTLAIRNDVDYPADAPEKMREIRRLANEGKYVEADRLFTKSFLGQFVPGQYEFAGKLVAKDLGKSAPRERVRSLDLFSGINRAKAMFSDGETVREIVALRDRNLVAVHYSTTRPGGLKLEFLLERPQATLSVGKDSLTLSGTVERGPEFRVKILLLPGKGGTVLRKSDRLVLRGGTEATLLYSACSDFNRTDRASPLKNWTKASDAALESTASTPWKVLEKEASDEMRGFMERCVVDLGTTPRELAEQPTGKRLEAYRGGAADPDLEELVFQFGRYLLVASSAADSLPANLQGIWSEGMKSPWAADYHININLQMNYWLADPTGLSEQNQSLMNFIVSLQEGGEKMAAALGYDGFCSGHAVNAWPPTWFAASKPFWGANLMSGAWVTGHLMEHYRYSGDREFLEKTAWPMMCRNVAFLVEWLEKEPATGKWVTGPGTSPENSFFYLDENGKQRKASVSCGSSFDLMLAWESLSDLEEAARVLGRENDPLVQRVQTILPDLARPRIAKDGRLEEWRIPTYSGEPEPGHRHISHAYGFFPGHQYNWIENPEQVEAIRKSIDYRLGHKGGQTGWSRAWLICLQAVLQRPEMAYENLRGLIVGHLNPNLFDLIGSPGTKSPFQIDANLGYVAGVATMLVQSQVVLPSGERVIQILPALPAAWPEGSVRGLHARGGLEIEMQWKPGAVDLVLHATRAGRFRIQCLEQERAVTVQPGQTLRMEFRATGK